MTDNTINLIATIVVTAPLIYILIKMYARALDRAERAEAALDRTKTYECNLSESRDHWRSLYEITSLALTKIEATIADCELAAYRNEKIVKDVERNLVQILCGPGSVIHDIVRSQLAQATPSIIEDAAQATLTKLKRSDDHFMESKITRFFDALITEQDNSK